MGRMEKPKLLRNRPNGCDAGERYGVCIFSETECWQNWVHWVATWIPESLVDHGDRVDFKAIKSAIVDT